MLDAKKILDQFLGSGAGGSGRPGGGGLADVVGGALSRMGGPGGAPQRQERRDGDPWGNNRNAPVPQRSGSPLDTLTQGGLGGVAGGAIAGTLASILLGKGKKSLPISSGALKLGGIAILGGLAYKAWQNYQQSQQSQQAPAAPQPQAGPVKVAPPPSQTTFSPSGPAEEAKVGELLVRAMIAAARADGHIDGAEMAKIREAFKLADVGGDEQAFLIGALSRTDDLDALAAEARGPELASEVWLAARLSIDPETPAEQAFLRTFAQKLGLDAGLVAHLEATAAQARQSGVEAA